MTPAIITTVASPGAGWLRVEDVEELVNEAYADGYNLGFEEGRRS